jgi:hypothetical protein
MRRKRRPARELILREVALQMALFRFSALNRQGAARALNYAVS